MARAGAGRGILQTAKRGARGEKEKDAKGQRSSKRGKNRRKRTKGGEESIDQNQNEKTYRQGFPVRGDDGPTWCGP
jgi:hypothetical protein